MIVATRKFGPRTRTVVRANKPFNSLAYKPGTPVMVEISVDGTDGTRYSIKLTMNEIAAMVRHHNEYNECHVSTGEKIK